MKNILRLSIKMSEWDTKVKAKVKGKDPMEALKYLEICDICGHTFDTLQLRRFGYLNKRNIYYVIRCCESCNPAVLTPYL